MSVEVRLHLEALNGSELSRQDKLTILRGQLTLIRERFERGIPVSVAAIRAAERMARSLEGQGITA